MKTNMISVISVRIQSVFIPTSQALKEPGGLLFFWSQARPSHPRARRCGSHWPLVAIDIKCDCHRPAKVSHCTVHCLSPTQPSLSPLPRSSPSISALAGAPPAAVSSDGFPGKAGLGLVRGLVLFSSICGSLVHDSYVLFLLVKGPCLVLVIEWQLRWTNMWLCEIHRRLVHIRWYHEGAHCIWDMTWSDVTKVEKIKMSLGLMDRLLGWRASYVMAWRRRTKATVKSKWGQDRWTNTVTWWYEVDHII
jgi:hypothetical protein